MKHDWLELLYLFIYACGFVGAAMCSAFVGAASQWSNSEVVPSKLQWWIIFAATIGAGFTALVAFMNRSVSTFMQKRNGQGSTQDSPAPLTSEPKTAQIAFMKKLKGLVHLGWACSICLLIVLCGCAYMHSTTERHDPTTGKLVERTTANAVAFFDANSQMTKFRNQSSPSTNTSGTYAPGTYIAGLDQNASSTNLNALAAALLQATAAGLIQGAK